MTETNIPRLRFKEYNRNWKEKGLLNLVKLRTGNRNAEDGLADGDFVFFDRSSEIKFLNEYDFDGEVIVYAGEGSKFLPRKFDGKYSLHQRAYGIYDFNKINFEFLYQELQNKNNHFLKYAVGTTAKSLRKDCFEKLIIKYPDLDEQQKIGSFFAKLNHLIELQTQKLEQLKKLKQGYLQKLFPQDGESVPRLRFSGFSGKWKKYSLNDLLEKIIDNRGKTPNNSSDDRGHPIIEVNSIGGLYPDKAKYSKFVDEKTFNTWPRKYIAINDVLFSTVGKVGLTSLVNDVNPMIAQNIVGLRFKKDIVYQLFAIYALKNYSNIKRFKRLEMRAIQPSLKVSQMIKVKLLIPNIDEQNKIGNLLFKLDQMINNQTDEIDELRQQKKAYLQKMFI